MDCFSSSGHEIAVIVPASFFDSPIEEEMKQNLTLPRRLLTSLASLQALRCLVTVSNLILLSLWVDSGVEEVLPQLVNDHAVR